MKKFTAVFLVCAMMFGALAGCTSGGSNAPAASSAPVESGAPAAPADKDEDDYKVLRYGLSSYEGEFMPIMADNVYDSQFCNLVFESLIDANFAGEYINELTESYELSNENLTYTFVLKDGITFSDGTPLTSADVEFTYHMMAIPDYNGPRAYAVNLLVGYDDFHSGASDTFSGIEVIDDRTISFTFVEGNASPANIESFVYGIMNKAYYEADTWEKFLEKLSTPGESGGSGPFMITEFKPKEMVRLVKDTDYWDIANNEVKIDEVLALEVASNSIVGALQTNQIDFGEPDLNMDNVRALDALPNIVRHNDVASGYTFMCYNTLNGIFDDVRVRQALLHALDRRSFIQVEYGELASLGLAPLSPVSWAFPDESELNPYEYDLELAASMLDDAGWVVGADGIREKDGKKFSIRWLVYTDANWPGTLSGLAADSWTQIGVDLKIDLMDFNTVSAFTMDAEIGEKDFDIYTMGFSLSIDPDPKGGLFDADTYGPGGFDASGFRNERAQELIQLGRASFDQDERAEIYGEWAKIINEQAATVVIAYRNFLWGWNDRVKGLNVTSMADWTAGIFDIEIVD